jgi:hypothetical protein
VKRSLLALVAVLVAATGASGATLSVAADKSSYLVGETVTLTVTADDQGAATTSTIFGGLLYNGALVDNGTQAQTQLIGQYGKWSLRALNQGDTNANSAASAFSWSFHQDPGVYALTANNLPGTLSTVTLIAQAVGVVNVTWDTTNPDTNLRLYFFGLTNAPGTSFTIVPEPVSAVLLGLGLLCLALGRSRRNAET